MRDDLVCGGTRQLKRAGFADDGGNRRREQGPTALTWINHRCGRPRGCIVLTDKAYDADWIRKHIERQGAALNIPDRANRKNRHYFSVKRCQGGGALIDREGRSPRLEPDRRPDITEHPLTFTRS